MTGMDERHFHTAEDEWLASYCAGGLSRAKRLILDCQAAINPRLKARLVAFDAVGGVMLESAKGEALSVNFMADVFGKLETLAPAPLAANKAKREDTGPDMEDWVPQPLIDCLKGHGQAINWKSMGFGMAHIPIWKEGREKLYLLKSKPGMKMPLHSHHGEEWALILQGGYQVNGESFVRGDVHREDETCIHRPIIDDDDGEACITLVAAEGGLKFSNPIFGVLKPLFGI